MEIIWWTAPSYRPFSAALHVIEVRLLIVSEQ